MKHNSIIVTSCYGGPLSKAIEKARALDMSVSAVVDSLLNGYRSFLIAPDGGCDDLSASDEGDARRSAMRSWLRTQKNDDGSSYLEWCEVEYGSGVGAKVVKHGCGKLEPESGAGASVDPQASQPSASCPMVSDPAAFERAMSLLARIHSPRVDWKPCDALAMATQVAAEASKNASEAIECLAKAVPALAAAAPKTAPAQSEEPKWLIWSNEHRAYLRGNGAGYTTYASAAGRYSRYEAEGLCHLAQHSIGDGSAPLLTMVREVSAQ